jgi:hypothetical protein
MWQIDPLLGNDSGANETTAVARQETTRNNASIAGSGVFFVVRSKVI